jgi:cellulose synthase/poly-beta-1,6-N-acetylglucosamine synthase-like glycosyltransferase
MMTAAVVFAAIVISLLAVQAVLAACFTALLARRRDDGTAGEKLPKAAVVLAVRGHDPRLRRNLRALLDQQYPDFAVHVVVDHATDPAGRTVRKLLAACPPGRLHVQFLEEPAASCSLKNSALVQAIRALDPSFEVVAFCDGDVALHRTWLRELVVPLADAKVGATTGNRWYAPPRAWWGSLVRYFWNTGAVVQMWLNGIVWAGSMAMRRSVIDEVKLLDVWGRSLSTDAVLARRLRQGGYRVRFVPSVLMINREDVSLGGCNRWMQRQLLTTRLYHPAWGSVVFHAMTMLMLQVFGLALAVRALWHGQWGPAVTAAIALGSYWAGSLLLAAALEAVVRRLAATRGEPVRWLRAATCWRLLPAFLLVHFIYPYAVLAASRQDRVVWRDVSYVIDGAYAVRMIGYRPYIQKVAPQNCSVV